MTYYIRKWYGNLSFAFFKSGPHCVQLALALRKLLIGVVAILFSLESFAIISILLPISYELFLIKSFCDICIGLFGIIGLCSGRFKINLSYAVINCLYFGFLTCYITGNVSYGIPFIDYLTFFAFSIWLVYRTVYDKLGRQR